MIERVLQGDPLDSRMNFLFVGSFGFILLLDLMNQFQLTTMLKSFWILYFFSRTFRTRLKDQLLFMSFCIIIVSDGLLLWTNWIDLGVLVFCLAHLINGLRLLKTSVRTTVLICAGALVGNSLNYVCFGSLGIELFYGLCLLFNAASAVGRASGSNEVSISNNLIGVLLFFGCDCMVIVYNVVRTVWVNHLAFFVLWLCYLPALWYLSISSLERS